MDLKKIMLLRWYTIPSWILIATIAYVNVRNKLDASIELLTIATIATMLWINLILLLEKFHEKIDGRPKIKHTWSFALLTITGLSLALLEPLSILIWFAMIGALWIYSKKATCTISSFVFIFRGLQEIGVYTIAVLVMTHKFDALIENASFLASIYLITTARNIIGDIRDTQFDFYTLPVIYGRKIAFGMSAVCTAIAIALVPIPLIALPLATMLVLSLLQINAYKLHEIYVISTGAYLTYILAFQIDNNLILVSLFYAAALTVSTYELVQRKSNILYFKEREKYENSNEEQRPQ